MYFLGQICCKEIGLAVVYLQLEVLQPHLGGIVEQEMSPMRLTALWKRAFLQMNTVLPTLCLI